MAVKRVDGLNACRRDESKTLQITVNVGGYHLLYRYEGGTKIGCPIPWQLIYARVQHKINMNVEPWNICRPEPSAQKLKTNSLKANPKCLIRQQAQDCTGIRQHNPKPLKSKSLGHVPLGSPQVGHDPYSSRAAGDNIIPNPQP